MFGSGKFLQYMQITKILHQSKEDYVSKNNQFSTEVKLNGEVIDDTVKETKLLGTIITNDLKWEKNIDKEIKEAKGSLQKKKKKCDKFVKKNKTRLQARFSFFYLCFVLTRLINNHSALDDVITRSTYNNNKTQYLRLRRYDSDFNDHDYSLT